MLHSTDKERLACQPWSHKNLTATCNQLPSEHPPPTGPRVTQRGGWVQEAYSRPDLPREHRAKQVLTCTSPEHRHEVRRRDSRILGFQGFLDPGGFQDWLLFLFQCTLRTLAGQEKILNLKITALESLSWLAVVSEVENLLPKRRPAPHTRNPDPRIPRIP